MLVWFYLYKESYRIRLENLWSEVWLYKRQRYVLFFIFKLFNNLFTYSEVRNIVRLKHVLLVLSLKSIDPQLISHEKHFLSIYHIFYVAHRAHLCFIYLYKTQGNMSTNFSWPNYRKSLAFVVKYGIRYIINVWLFEIQFNCFSIWFDFSKSCQRR